MMHILNRKSQILYDMNCIEKYITPGQYDESLSKAWNGYKRELNQVEEELKLLSNPDTRALEEQKLAISHQIDDHKKHVRLLEHKMEEIDKKIYALI